MNSSLDANVILQYIWGSEPTQQRKAAKLLSDSSQTFFISDLVLAEVVFNLQAAQTPRRTVVQILTEIASLRNVRISDLIVDQVLPFYLAHPALSFVDCYAAFTVENSHAEPLWTFDRKLANQHPSAKKL